MKIEWLIGFYMLVCVAMIAFNFAFLANEKVQTRRLARKRRRLAAKIAAQVDGVPTDEDLRALERSLKTLSGLEAFDQTLARLKEEDPERCAGYLQAITPVLERLSHWHAGKSALRDAYYSYILNRWYAKRPANAGLIDALLTAVRTRPFYARENALMAIAKVGTAPALADAIVGLESARTFHHPKLVTEALLSYPGDREELAEELSARFDRLSPNAQAAVINFGRMADIPYQDERLHTARRERLKALMVDPATDLEVRLACIRFFMRDPWDDVADTLRDFAAHDGTESWEYAAVAASTLVSYPGDETVAVLKKCLSSRVWHVRQNAAQSLRGLGLSRDELRDVVEGPDRFARDTVLYHWREEA